MMNYMLLLIPFAGTCLGSFMVFFMKEKISDKLEKVLLGFAAGVMVAASVWSLLIPSLELAGESKISWVPAAVGFMLGIVFLLLIDCFVPHLHLESDKPEGVKSKLQKSSMLLLAVTIHNIPEGMAVGVAFAGVFSGNTNMSLMGAVALAVGISIQNFPEGAIISMPLKETGISKGRAFIYGSLSGAVEPVAALITIALTAYIVPVLPYILSFAAGAMIYVVVEELVPESQNGEHTNIGTIGFALGFVLMMILDVALG